MSRDLDQSDLVRSFKELDGTDCFDAEIHLENRFIADYTKHLLQLDTANQTFALEYARIQGQLEAIKAIQSVRQQYINSQPSTALAKEKD